MTMRVVVSFMMAGEDAKSLPDLLMKVVCLKKLMRAL